MKIILAKKKNQETGEDVDTLFRRIVTPGEVTRDEVITTVPALEKLFDACAVKNLTVDALVTMVEQGKFV